MSYLRTRSLWKCQSRECCALGTSISFPTVNLGGAPSHLSFEMSCSFTIQVLAQLVLLRNFAFFSLGDWIALFSPMVRVGFKPTAESELHH